MHHLKYETKFKLDETVSTSYHLDSRLVLLTVQSYDLHDVYKFVYFTLT